MSRVEAAPLVTSVVLCALIGAYASAYEHRPVEAGALIGAAIGGFVYLLKTAIYSKIDIH